MKLSGGETQHFTILFLGHPIDHCGMMQ